MRQETVDLIWENQLLKLDALLAQSFHQADSFDERHVAIVIAVDQ